MPLVDISRYDGWFWDTEIMAYCIYSGLRIKEISCVFERRGYKKSSVRILDTVAVYMTNLIEFKLYLMRSGKEMMEKRLKV